MSHTVKDAKNNLSSLIRLAEKGQPQVIKRHDKEVAVVVSIEAWRKAHGKEETFLEFLQRSELREILLYLERSDEPVREFSFE